MRVSLNKFYLAAVLLLGIVIDWLVLWHEPGLGMSLALLFTLVIFLGLRISQKRPANVFDLMLIPIVILIAGLFFRADEFVKGLNILFLLVALPSYFFLSSNKASYTGFYESYFPQTLIAILSSLRDGVAGINLKFTNNNTFLKIFVGLVLTLPLLVIVLALLSSADQVFAGQIDGLLEFDLASIITFIISLGLSFVVITFSLGFVRRKQAQFDNKLFGFLDHEFRDLIIPVMITYALAFIYLVFLVIQFEYLLDGEAFAQKNNLILSEYAIKGFWEMMLVVSINLFVLYNLITRFSLKQKLNKLLLFPAYLFINFASLVMVYSSHIRLSVYEDTYGFTRSRLIPHQFLIFLLMVVLLTAAVLFIKQTRRRQVLFFGYVAAVSLLMIGMNLFSMDRFIVKNNIEYYQSTDFNENVVADYNYFYELGVEGQLEIERQVAEGELGEEFLKPCDITKLVLDNCSLKLESLQDKYENNSWQSRNYQEILLFGL